CCRRAEHGQHVSLAPVSGAKLPPVVVSSTTSGGTMDILLFSERSIWTMIHGIALGGGALLTSFAMLFFLIALRISGDEAGTQLSRETHWFTWLAVANVVLLWLAVIIGTYVTFPPYRA